MNIDSKIEDNLYKILFDHSSLSDGNIGVRVCFEDEWPLEELKSLLLDSIREVVGDIEGEMEDGAVFAIKTVVRNQLRREILEKAKEL